MEQSSYSEGENSELLEKLKLFWNPYSLHVYREFLDYILDGKEYRLVEEAIFSNARIDAKDNNFCGVLCAAENSK